MDVQQARAALSTLFANTWGATTPITWDGTVPDTPGTAFVRFSVQHTTSMQVSWGDDKQNWMHYGIACVQIFVRSGTGTALSDQLAQKVKQYLMGKHLGEMTTHHATVHEDGPDGHGWDQTRVLVRFEYAEQTA